MEALQFSLWVKILSNRKIYCWWTFVVYNYNTLNQNNLCPLILPKYVFVLFHNSLIQNSSVSLILSSFFLCEFHLQLCGSSEISPPDIWDRLIKALKWNLFNLIWILNMDIIMNFNENFFYFFHLFSFIFSENNNIYYFTFIFYCANNKEFKINISNKSVV